jgi:hypothetical protein
MSIASAEKADEVRRPGSMSNIRRSDGKPNRSRTDQTAGPFRCGRIAIHREGWFAQVALSSLRRVPLPSLSRSVSSRERVHFRLGTWQNVDAATGRTQFFGNTLGPHRPSPAPLMIDGTALRADHAPRQLLLVLVPIGDVILLGASGNATRGSLPLRPQARCLHLASLASFSIRDVPGNAVCASGMPRRFSSLT